MRNLLYIFCFFGCFGVGCVQGQNHKNEAVINIVAPKLSIYDTMKLYRYPEVLNEQTNRYVAHMTYSSSVNNDSIYRFHIKDLYDVEYIVLGNRMNEKTQRIVPILEYYPVFPGDSITVKLEWDSSYHAKDHLIPVIVNYQKKMIPDIVRFPYLSYFTQYRIQFSGVGSAKYQCRYRINRADIYDVDKQTIDSLIDAFKLRLDPLAWEILKADVIGRYEKSIFGYHFTKTDSPMKEKTDEYFKNINPVPEISEKSQILSFYYPDALISRACFKYPRHAFYKIIAYLSKNYEGELRDRLLTIYSLEKQLPDSALLITLNTIKTAHFRNIIQQYIDDQRVGAKAYNFSLPDKDGKLVSLSDFKGKVVFLDFWFTGCHACSMLYQEDISEIEELYLDNNSIVFISISIDQDKDKWLKSINKGLYTSSAAINLYTGGRGHKDPVIDNYNVSGYPTLFLIDKKGRIRARNRSLYRKEKAIHQIDNLLKID